MKLRDYQQRVYDDITAAWHSGSINNLAVMPTGAGKTALFSRMASDEPGYSVAIAHRQELIAQMSLAYARWGTLHQIVTKDRGLIDFVNTVHVEELGRSFIDPSSRRLIGGVRSIINSPTAPWMDSCALWIMDEAHHITHNNEFGKAVARFPRARGLGVTATPLRADGMGLGRHADGVFDALVVGPTMRDLIDRQPTGFLCDYRIAVPPTDLHLDHVAVSDKTGDYVQPQLAKAVHESHIVGDAVHHYLKMCPGKRAVAFNVDVEAATETAAAFNAEGIPSIVLSAKTPDLIRRDATKRFKAGEILVICNVDLLGEGYDCPAIESVIFMRPTKSYGLYVQQFGRALRPLDGKTHGLIIDMVGNVLMHGLPDAPRQWSLDRRNRKAKTNPDEIPLRVCDQCLGVYQRVRTGCPYCGKTSEPAERGTIEQVDGDLIMLDDATLQRMRGEVEENIAPPTLHSDPMINAANQKRHREKMEALEALKRSVEWWLGYKRAEGYSIQETYRLFWFHFGVDVLTAGSLSKKEAYDLTQRVAEGIGLAHKKHTEGMPS